MNDRPVNPTESFAWKSPDPIVKSPAAKSPVKTPEQERCELAGIKLSTSIDKKIYETGGSFTNLPRIQGPTETLLQKARGKSILFNYPKMSRKLLQKIT